MKKILLFLAGIVLILVGVIGLIMPVLPGWGPLFLGLSFIAPQFAARLKGRFYRHFFKKNIVYFEEWRRLNVHAGISTRHFPLVIGKTDELKNPATQQTLKALLMADPVLRSHGVNSFDRFVCLNQVHEDTVAVLDAQSGPQPGEFQHLTATDGVITNIRDLNLIVLTADCLSVYLCAGDWVGLVHAGWRGTQKEITLKAYNLIKEKSGQNDVKIIFGPCIRKENYEVGPEFKQYFSRSVLEKNGKLYFDLAGENKRQLLAHGVRAEQILDLEICTAEENKTFYSFRREKDKAGRMISFINRSIADKKRKATT